MRRASSYRNSGYWDSYGKACHLLKEIVLYKASSKLTEETPSPFMTDELRLKMGEAAVKALNTSNEGAGTVEFWLISTVISILWK
jgi:acetyl-CoA carboxylase biotin carboxylase subunit